MGYSLRELAGKAFTVIVAPELVEETIDRFRKGISGGTTPAYIAELVHRNKHRIPVEFVVTTLYDQKGKSMGRFGTGRDISERMKTAREMEKSREELRALAKRLQEIREEERTSIARDLHDDLGQTLTALKMDIAWLSREMGHRSGSPPGRTSPNGSTP
jgi:PAS domain S-box-containing protein